MVLLVSAIISFIRGFIKEVLTIVGLIGGVIAAYFFAPSVKTHFISWLVDPENKDEKLWGLVPMEMVASAAAYGAIFIATFILLTIVSHFASKAVQEMGLNAVDRSLGVVFGLARGFLLIVLIYLPFSLLMEEDEAPKWLEGSRSIPVIEYTINWSYDNFGIKDQADKVKDKADNVEETIKETQPLRELLLNGVKDKIDTLKKAPEGQGYEDKDRKKLENLIEMQGAPLEALPLNE